MIRLKGLDWRIQMANLDDLGIISIADKSTDEALEHLRQIRLSRRTPVAKKTSSTRKPSPPKMSVDQAAELLRILQGG